MKKIYGIIPLLALLCLCAALASNPVQAATTSEIYLTNNSEVVKLNLAPDDKVVIKTAGSIDPSVHIKILLKANEAKSVGKKLDLVYASSVGDTWNAWNGRTLTLSADPYATDGNSLDLTSENYQIIITSKDADTSLKIKKEKT
jgi:hypothetical protein